MACAVLFGKPHVSATTDRVANGMVAVVEGEVRGTVEGRTLRLTIPVQGAPSNCQRRRREAASALNLSRADLKLRRASCRRTGTFPAPVVSRGPQNDAGRPLWRARTRMVSSRASARWHAAAGMFAYAEFELLDIAYNVASSNGRE
jgi:hypothetical protein